MPVAFIGGTVVVGGVWLGMSALQSSRLEMLHKEIPPHVPPEGYLPTHLFQKSSPKIADQDKVVGLAYFANETEAAFYERRVHPMDLNGNSRMGFSIVNRKSGPYKTEKVLFFYDSNVGPTISGSYLLAWLIGL
jgi:hypothetical protein